MMLSVTRGPVDMDCHPGLDPGSSSALSARGAVSCGRIAAGSPDQVRDDNLSYLPGAIFDRAYTDSIGAFIRSLPTQPLEFSRFLQNSAPSFGAPGARISRKESP
jgi:hypothetical protein